MARERYLDVSGMEKKSIKTENINVCEGHGKHSEERKK